ncbi:MAG: twin-arginine translocase subunit TatC [Chlorobi bacterium]|nr:twin-arginine translocase subunit TatC [Chlorobiota bacterium]
MSVPQEELPEFSILDHLNDLRKMIMHSLLAIFVMAGVAFTFKNIIFDKILFAPLDPDFVTYRFFCKLSDMLCIQKIPVTLISRQLQGQFSVHIWTSVYAGIILAFPYIVYEIWKYVSPALYTHEKKAGIKFIVVTSVLFFMGILFGYYIITPLVINFLGNYQISERVENYVDIKSYIANVRTTVLAVGLVFELPVLIYFFTKLGLVSSEFLRRNRKYAIVAILIVSAVITPPDVISQIIVSIPLIILYEVSIWIAKLIEKNRSTSLKPSV